LAACVRNGNVRDNKQADRRANLSQAFNRIADLEKAVLDLTALVLVVVDPADGDLTDDGA